MADLSKAGHLPNLRPDRQPPHPSWLPRQRRGTTPQMIGRYPDYDVFDAASTWDVATAKVVTDRMAIGSGARDQEGGGPGGVLISSGDNGPGDGQGLRFFRVEEEATLRAFCDVVVAQDEDPRIPVAEMVDDKLFCGRLDGYQYADMPDDRDTWHLVLAGLDEVAVARYGRAGFAQCEPEAALAIVEGLAHATLEGGSWDQLNVARAWAVCMRSILAAFYSHPWAWNEIGFGGPAYPRGYMRLGPVGNLEPFEKPGATSEDPAQVANQLGPN
ncbi:MAG: gluconate 2-dehydrogenase subunit 3 family protein [Acidimicrobiales bacterium]